METFWQVAVRVAGVAAIASFVLWSLYRQFMRLHVWQRMTKRQQFWLFVLFLSFPFILALFGMVAYTIVELNRSPDRDAKEAVKILRERRQEVSALLNDVEVDPELMKGFDDALKTLDSKANALEMGEHSLYIEHDNKLDYKIKILDLQVHESEFYREAPKSVQESIEKAIEKMEFATEFDPDELLKKRAA